MTTHVAEILPPVNAHATGLPTGLASKFIKSQAPVNMYQEGRLATSFVDENQHSVAGETIVLKPV